MDKAPAIPPLNPKGTWRTYTTADGLAGLQTEHIAEDAEGYLWIGTWADGASRFDGDEFRTFTTKDGLPGNRVQAILLDQQGRLWFGTSGGVCWWDGKRFRCFAAGDEVSDRSISFLFEDQEGRIWFGGNQALGYWDGSTFCDLVPEYRRQCGEAPSRSWYECRGIAQDREGQLWFAFFSYTSANADLVRYDGKRFYRYAGEEGLSSAVSYTICQVPEGELWVGGDEKVWRWDGQEFQPLPLKLGSPIRKIQRDREGRMWFCTSNNGDGVFCFDGSQFHHFTTQDGLASNAVNAMHQDREGLLWFATWGGGLSCYDPHGLRVFGESEGLPQNWRATLAEDRQGHIWMGFWGQHLTKIVAQYNGERFAFFGKEEGLDLGECVALCEDRAGQLWLGGLQGLVRYDGQQFQRIGTEEGFGEFTVSAIAEDPSGYLLLGHWEKTISVGEALDWSSPLRMTRYDSQDFQTLFTTEQAGDNFCYISTITIGRNQELYFALSSRGTVGVGRGLGRWHERQGITFYTTAEGLADNNAEDLLVDRQGQLWIATLGGISRFDGTRFQNFTMEHGLPGKWVFCLCEDQQGRLWFGTDGGVALYDGQNFQVIQSEHLAFTTDILEDRQGRFWFATRKGAVLYIPGQIPPRIRLLQVIADQVYQEVREVTISTATPWLTDRSLDAPIYCGHYATAHTTDCGYLMHKRP